MHVLADSRPVPPPPRCRRSSPWLRLARAALTAGGLLMAAAALPVALAGDQPQWGQAWTRNLVSSERHLPASFDLASGRNVKWSVKIGTESHATPVIAGGRVLIGTNNGEPRDTNHLGDRGVLMCLDEATGALRWQLVVPKRVEDIYFDWPNAGLCSPPTIEGDRAYVVDNRGVVLCLDLHGLGNGNDGPFTNEAIYYAPQPTNDLAQGAPAAFTPDGRVKPDVPPPNRVELGPLDADILWMFDLSSGAGIWSHDATHSSILIHGPHLYLNTGTGVDNTHRKIRRPEAPSLVVLDKATGRLLGREREGIGPDIFHSTWAPPAKARIGGRELILFAAGNGMVYGFEPLATNSAPPDVQTLKKVFQIDFDPTAPKTEVHRYNLNKREGPSNFYGAPIFDAERIYVAGGGDLWWGKNEAWLKSYDVPIAGNAPVTTARWSYPLGRHTFTTPVPHKGLVYAADCSGGLHCVDAASGQPVWTHELDGEAWASPFLADGRLYIGTRRGAFYIFATGRDKQLLFETKLGAPVSATAVAANGTLYVTTMNRLHALAPAAN